MIEDITPEFDPAEEPKKDTSREWVLDDAARVRIDAQLAEIDGIHSAYPKCVVCGIRTNPDKYGCCSKTSEPHKHHRNEMRVRT